MADIRSIDMADGKITINLEVSKAEYEFLEQETRELILLPSSPETLDLVLTTGKLGNSNRIMLPKKYLRRYNLTELPKKAVSRIFKMDEEIFLLIKLKEGRIGVPIFGE